MNWFRFRKLLIFIVLTGSVATWLPAETESPDPSSLEQERRIKEDAERQAQAICDSILGKDQSSVLVSVELGLESTRRGGTALSAKRDSKTSLPDNNFLLPWVPAPKSVTKEETPKDASVETQASQQATVDVKTVFKRFDITVVHDEGVPEDRITFAKDTLAAAFERYKNVLKIYFKATRYVKQNFNPRDAVTKNLWDSINFKNVLLLFLLMLAYMLLKFFFGPLAEFMKSYIDGMREQSKSRVEMENKSETENESESDTEGEDGLAEGEMTPEELEALNLEEEAMHKFEPFKYVTDENVKQLAYLLHHEEPWVVAMVISYLSPEHAFKVMEMLPADLQAKVALETALYRQTSLDQVAAIDEDIKQKIDFVVGGLEKLLVILESSDRMSRDNILDYLKNEKPAIYEKVRENILLFEDIVNFPKNAMQVVVRELKTEQLARALRGASPEMQQKFFENMSQGAATLLKEEMEFGRPVTDEQIEEERRKIVDLIKVMEKDSKISFRQAKKMNSLDGADMQSSPRAMGLPTGNPEAALQAYNAGMAAAEQGQTEEAIGYFEESVRQDPLLVVAHHALANAYYGLGRYQEALTSYETVLSIEPSDELQAFVEELRASLSAQAA